MNEWFDQLMGKTRLSPGGFSYWALLERAAPRVAEMLHRAEIGEVPSDPESERRAASGRLLAASRRAASLEEPSLYTLLDGGIAAVELRGPITKHGGWYGFASAALTRRAIRAASRDREVSGILLLVDSPGGSVAGIADLAEDVGTASGHKPTWAYIEDLGASAAYWIASAAGTVLANASAEVGSIGVFTVLRDYSVLFESEGIETLVFRYGEMKGAGAVGSRITEAQRAEFQRQVDAYGELFARAVSSGRGMSLGDALSLSDGRTHLAPEAERLGLIDGVAGLDAALEGLRAATSRAGSGTIAGRNASERPTSAVGAAADIDGTERDQGGATAMEVKLKDGKTVGWDYIAKELAAGRSVELATGQVYAPPFQASAGPAPPPGADPATTPASPSAAAPAAVVDLELERRKSEALGAARGAEAEKNRILEIEAFGAMSGLPASAIQSAKASGQSAESFRQTALSHYTALRPATAENAPGSRIEAGPDKDVESFFQAVPDALAVRCEAIGPDGLVATNRSGVKRETRFTLHDRYTEFLNYSLMDIVDKLLHLNGVQTLGKPPVKRLKALKELNGGVRAAGYQPQTTGDFTTLFENTMNKLMAAGIANAATTFREWTGRRPLNDLRQHNLYKRGGFNGLRRISESGEVPRQALPDGKKETMIGYLYAGLFALTDEVFINDDMGALSGIVAEFGQTPELTLSDLVVYTLMSNPTMNEDGKALFHADHNNLGAGANAGVPSAATFDYLYTQMRLQRTLSGRPARLEPDIGLFPVSLRATVELLLESQYLIGGTNQEANIYKGRIRPIFEPSLDTGVTLLTDADPNGVVIAGDPAAWYGMVAPNANPTIVVGYVPGLETPELMMERQIGIVGTEWRVVTGFGVGVEEYRTAHKNEGA